MKAQELSLEEKLNRHARRWREMVGAPHLTPTNMPMAEDAIKQIYLRYKTKAPMAVIWCESPFQLGVIPAVVTNVLDGPGVPHWTALTEKLAAAGTAGSSEWDRAWTAGWEKLKSDYLEEMAMTLMSHPGLRPTSESVRKRAIESVEKPLREIALKNRIKAGSLSNDRARKQAEKRRGGYLQPSLDWNFMKATLKLNHRIEQEAGLELSAISMFTWMSPFVGVWDKRLIATLIPGAEPLIGAPKKIHGDRLSQQIRFVKEKCDTNQVLYMRFVGFWLSVITQPRREHPLRIEPGASVVTNTVSAFGHLATLHKERETEPKQPLNVVNNLFCWLPHFIPWLPFALGCRFLDDDPLASMMNEIDDWGYLSRGAFGCFLTEQMAFLCKKPLEYLSNNQQLPHNPDGPAISWEDGSATFAWQGMIIDERIIMHPETITHQEITAETNAEIRRVMIEKFGDARYLQAAGAKKIHEDECGILFRTDLPGDEPIVMVKVKNSTQEPDGSYKYYYLRVPPEMQTAKQAVAWTFEMEPDQYRPELST